MSAPRIPGRDALHVLLLADDQRASPNTIHDHIQAFSRYSRHTIRLFNPRNLSRSRFLDLSEFDAVVIHYSLVVVWNDYISPWFREQIAEYDGLKIQFIQDEYRMVDEITEEIRRMKIDVLYSVVPPDRFEAIYGDRLAALEILPTLTGYVPEDAVGRLSPPLDARPIDIGYRGRTLPYWLGRLGHEKVEIGRGFLARQDVHGLRCDVAWSEGARIYGQQWYEWIGSCRAMLGSESGSSIVDYDHSAENAVRDYLSAHPTASYEEVEEAVLEPFSAGPVINTVSPRVFETAAMRTASIMFPGEYSGVVHPWEHYIPLEKDFSNVGEIAERVRDARFLEKLTSRAYDHLIASGSFSYRAFVEGFDDDVAARVGDPRRAGRFRAVPLRLEEMSTGRTYRLSALYTAAREVLLGYLGVKSGIRHAPLRRLALLAARRRPAVPGVTTLRDDLFRLALLTSIRTSPEIVAGEQFDIHSTIEAGSLRFTSRPRGEGRDDLDPSEVADALRCGTLREIVWNHAGVGQYVHLRLPFVAKSIGFDVGRYDAYGVYRFRDLMGVAQDQPDLVLAALEPLLRVDTSEQITPHNEVSS